MKDALCLPDSLLREIKDALGPKGWSDDPDRLSAKTVDWRGRYHGHSPLLAAPATTQEVAAVVRACAKAGVAITPQGGNTGLVGGGVPQGEVLLTLDRMRAVRSVDPENDSMTVEAGLPLALVHDQAEAVDRLFPLSLGSQGTATIGGLVSTNAGGVAVLRYGMMRDLVLGLEAVMPDGRIWNGLSPLRKDNTGYDLKQLLIGAEGTLGVVTAASLKLFPRPGAKPAAFCAVVSPDVAPAFLALAKSVSGDAVTAFELIPQLGLDLVLRHVPDTRAPLDGPHAWYVLLELSLADADRAGETMEAVLSAAFDAGLIADAAIAQSDAQAQDFWKLRETLPEAEKHHGPAIKHDVSAPVSAIGELVARSTAAATALLREAQIIAFGHVGDGNIHFNVGMPEGMDRDAFFAMQPAMNAAVHDAAASLGGSISAEHGVGVMKIDELARLKSPVALDAMRAIKQALDPKGVMNPRVLFAGSDSHSHAGQADATSQA